jgi:hypothetical protein
VPNPAVDHIFAADPSAHVFDDRLYVYVTYDEPGTNSYDSMKSYHCLSTDDFANWTDHGRILTLDSVPWALSHLWAYDCNFWQGRYHLIFCAFEKETGTFKAGLAVSDLPQGPFENLGFIEGVDWGQDPSFFVDDDGKPYIIWGGRGQVLIAELNDDLLSVKAETIVDVSGQINGYEGPFVHKYQGVYYLTYPALENEEWPQRMRFATATSIFGPYSQGGEFIPVYEGNSGTIHGSVVEFRGKWYSFYHSAFASGKATNRSLMVDEIRYDEAGRIIPFMPSRTGVAATTKTVISLDAAAAEKMSGKLYGTRVEQDNSNFSGIGYVTGLTRQEYGVSVLFEVGVEREYEVRLRYRAAEKFNGRVLFGRHLFYDGNQNQSYEQYINRGTEFPATGEDWSEIVIGIITVAPGEYQVRLSASHNLAADQQAIDIDRFDFVPVE